MVLPLKYEEFCIEKMVYSINKKILERKTFFYYINLFICVYSTNKKIIKK
jgi:hypothetical protein